MDNQVRVLPPGARPPRTGSSAWGGILPLLFALLYGASPIDIIPDVIPLLGWSDDVMVFIIAGTLIFKWWRKKKAPAYARP